MAITGQLRLDGVELKVTGKAWMDHQWGNFTVSRIGWDWFAFQLENNVEYNLYSFRDESGNIVNQFVNIIDAVGVAEHGTAFTIEPTTFWQSPVTGKIYGTAWMVTIPDRDEVFKVEATIPDQEMVPTQFIDIAPLYWEGRCRVERVDLSGAIISGVGYTEQFPLAVE